MSLFYSDLHRKSLKPTGRAMTLAWNPAATATAMLTARETVKTKVTTIRLHVPPMCRICTLSIPTSLPYQKGLTKTYPARTLYLNPRPCQPHRRHHHHPPPPLLPGKRKMARE